MSLRVLVIDDHVLIREGLRRLISRDQTIHVVGEAASKREALAQISHHDPDVIVVDLQLPDGSGLDVIAWARSASQKNRHSRFNNVEYARTCARFYAIRSKCARR